ncbi:DUF4434 domain-containing protein [Legionella massiliensis]|nr:DUF4434 domain-containing protein [Legionella massiliensis]
MIIGRYVLIPACPLKRVNTSFLQLYVVHSSLSESDWEALFKQTRHLYIKHLILQWSSYGDQAFYGEGQETLSKIIKAAAKEGLDLTIGLNYDPKFWSALSASDAALQTYMIARYQQQSQALPILLATIKAADPEAKTVRGWYLSDELDDQSWQSPSRRSILKDYLGAMTKELKKETPDWSIRISTFSSGQASMAAVAEFYNFLFAIESLDKILFQDSIGTGKLNLGTLELYLKTIDSQLAGNKARFGVISELFITAKTQTGFKAAPPERVVKQLKLARKYSDTDVTLFSIFIFVLPVDPAGVNSGLYKFWLQEVRHCKGL